MEKNGIYYWLLTVGKEKTHSPEGRGQKKNLLFIDWTFLIRAEKNYWQGQNAYYRANVRYPPSFALSSVMRKIAKKMGQADRA